MNKLSRERLKKWFKNNCTDVGHIYYGQIMSLLTPVPEEMLKSKQYLYDWAREIMNKFPEINEIMTESRLRELGIELILKYKEG